MRQVRIDIESHAVQRHPLLHADTDGSDLVLVAFALFGPAHPNANTVFAPLGAYIEGGERAYGQFFERGDKPAHVRATALEIKHDISDALAWPVISHLPPAATLVDRETRLDYVGQVCAGARRVEWRVLQ